MRHISWKLQKYCCNIHVAVDKGKVTLTGEQYDPLEPKCVSPIDFEKAYQIAYAENLNVPVLSQVVGIREFKKEDLR